MNADVYKWNELKGEYIAVGPGSALKEAGGQAGFGMCSLPDGWPTLQRAPACRTTNPLPLILGPTGVLWLLLSLNQGGISSLDFHIDASFSQVETKREGSLWNSSIFPLNRRINLSPCSVEEALNTLKPQFGGLVQEKKYIYP